MNKIFRYSLKIALIAVLITVIIFINSNKALADQLKLTLKEIGADKNVKLLTVKTYRDFYFTKPEQWKVLPSSKLILSFQHSPQLLRERSSLNILINNQVIKTIELNKNNAKKTTTTVDIPVKILKDHNKLTFDVDQHYTMDCEDPFDPALWTTVLNSSTIQLDYTRMPPKTGGHHVYW